MQGKDEAELAALSQSHGGQIARRPRRYRRWPIANAQHLPNSLPQARVQANLRTLQWISRKNARTMIEGERTATRGKQVSREKLVRPHTTRSNTHQRRHRSSP